MGRIRASSASIGFGPLCLLLGAACLVTACNMPGVSDTASFAGSAGTSSATPPLGGSGGSAPNPNPTNTQTSGSVNNVLSFEIGSQGVCGTDGSVNQPCASVTICVPGTSTCQTISDLLVDTGSYGLRVFSSAVSLSLPQLTSTSGQALAECAQFGTGADWGSVVQASVQLAGEAKVTIPIQLINSTYAGGPPTVAVNSGCTDLDTSPEQAGFNGILGVGLTTQDCGSYCVTEANSGLYFECSGTTCSGADVALANQVVNPVSSLSQDNNGLVFTLPAISASGAASVAGSVIFGVGTESNNQPGAAVKTYLANSDLEITTSFNNESYTESFIDSGSNGLFFPVGTLSSTLPTCGSNTTAPGWFCPTATAALSGTNESNSGSTSAAVSFSIANSVSLFSTNNVAYDDLGANSSVSSFTGSFDWGLPFFFGRSVYVGVSGIKSSLGTGPYWAY